MRRHKLSPDLEAFDSLSRTYDALERLGEGLARRTPGDLSYRVSAPQDLPEIDALGNLINGIVSDWETFVKKEVSLTTKKTLDLSQAYNVVQEKNEEIRRDLDTARRVQLQLLPRPSEISCRPGLEFSGFYQSMESVGGDLYDFVRIGRNAYGFLVADVSGHGVPASMITMLIQAAFRSRARWGVGTDVISSEVNSVLYSVLADLGFFVTAFLGIVDLEKGTLRYTNCGHPSPLLFHQSEPKPTLLDETGIILGPFADETWKQSEVPLQSGDTLFAYTDGITEAQNYFDEFYGLDRLIGSLGRGFQQTKGEILGQTLIESVNRDLRDFTMGAPVKDDQTMLVLQYDGVKLHKHEHISINEVLPELVAALQIRDFSKATTLLQEEIERLKSSE